MNFLLTHPEANLKGCYKNDVLLLISFLQNSHSSYVSLHGYSYGILLGNSREIANMFAYKLVVCEPKQNF